MKVDNIFVNTQSSIKIILDKTVYFDPFGIDEKIGDADIIFITHDHYDHMDEKSINNVKNDSTIVVAPKSMEDVINKIKFKDYIYLNPGEETNIYGINVKTIPAYNVLKPFHPKRNNYLGYVVSYNEITYYIAGDTDRTKEAESVLCDIALLPIGGHFTMDASDAAKLVKKINPKVVIPTHYGSIVGNKTDSKKLIDNLSDTNIKVIEKLFT